MRGVAWKDARANTEELQYVLQVEDIKGVREENRIVKFLSDWNSYGFGYSPKDRTQTIMFKKEFETEGEWKRWARKFPHILEEITEKTGKKKPYKLGLDYQTKKRKGRA